MKKNQVIILLLSTLLLGDLVFSFIQYYNTPLFGDITVSAWPDRHVEELLNDPLGFHVLKTGEKAFNPNRYFSHLILKEYFQNIPLFLQKIVSPVSSVYLASALAKIIVQILFIFILARFISTEKLLSIKFLTVTLIITPLFQVYGYWSRMGIVDKSVAYTFFYALPLILLMLFFLPIFKQILNNSGFKKINYLYLTPLVIILPFTGPLNPPVIILVSFCIFLNYRIRSKQKGIIAVAKTIPVSIYILLIPISILSLYSLFLGLYDSSFSSMTISVWERYTRLPKGIMSQLFHSPGYPLLWVIIGINMFIINKNNFSEKIELARTLKWIGIFSLLYILLLPLGGYRPYRPNIIRYDTLIPVNIAVFYFFGVTTYQVFNRITGRKKRIYFYGIVAYLLLLTIVDIDGIKENQCERNAFDIMAESTRDVVAIPKGCFVLDWSDVNDYNLTKNKAELIHYWGVTDKTKLFYNEP